jgi:hypothetical protein
MVQLQWAAADSGDAETGKSRYHKRHFVRRPLKSAVQRLRVASLPLKTREFAFYE